MPNDYPGLRSGRAAGDRRAFPPSVIVDVKALACELPKRFGLPLSRWSLGGMVGVPLWAVKADVSRGTAASIATDVARGKIIQAPGPPVTAVHELWAGASGGTPRRRVGSRTTRRARG